MKYLKKIFEINNTDDISETLYDIFNDIKEDKYWSINIDKEDKYYILKLNCLYNNWYSIDLLNTIMDSIEHSIKYMKDYYVVTKIENEVYDVDIQVHSINNLRNLLVGFGEDDILSIKFTEK